MTNAYYRFRGDLFSLSYNFSQSATVTSKSDDEAIVRGVFRTNEDYGELIWSS